MPGWLVQEVALALLALVDGCAHKFATLVVEHVEVAVAACNLLEVFEVKVLVRDQREEVAGGQPGSGLAGGEQSLSEYGVLVADVLQQPHVGGVLSNECYECTVDTREAAVLEQPG